MVKIRNNVTLKTWNWFSKIWHIQPVRYSTTFRNRGAETDQWVFPGGGGAPTFHCLNTFVIFLMFYFEITRFTHSCKK